MCQLLDERLNRYFKVIPIADDSDTYKITKVGPQYWLVRMDGKFKADVFWNGNDKFSYCFIVGKNLHYGDIFYKDIFFTEINPETGFKAIKPQEYAALRK